MKKTLRKINKIDKMPEEVDTMLALGDQMFGPFKVPEIVKNPKANDN